MPTFDAVAGLSSSGGGPFVWAHTCTGSDLVLVVNISIYDSADTVTAVTYNGVAMSSRGSVSNGQYTVYQYILVAPATGSNNVSVSVSESVFDFGGTSISLTDTDQSTPAGTTVTASGTSTTPSVTATSAADEIVVDGLIIVHSGTLTVGADQTERRNTIAGSGFVKYAASTAAGSTPTMDWSNSSSQAWAIIATPFKPVAAASGQPLVKRLAGVPYMNTSFSPRIW